MLPGWIDSIAHASPPFLVFALVATLFGFYLGFSSLRRYRLIEDVPTAKVRSAHQGYVELVGDAVMMDGEPIVAPLSQTQCCWYSYRVEERSGKNWHVVDRGVSDGLFVLRDDTGDCVIDPEGASIDTVHAKVWSGDGHSLVGGGVHQRSSDGSAHRSKGLLTGLNVGIDLGVGSYRYSEKVILHGDPIYAIGWFRSLDNGDHADTEDHLVREILRQWKQHPETLRERFDHDRNDTIDIEEWEEARQAARQLAREQLAEQRTSHEHVHTLVKPANRQFIVSNREQDVLVSRYKWRAVGGFVTFFIGGSFATIMLTTQFFGG